MGHATVRQRLEHEPVGDHHVVHVEQVTAHVQVADGHDVRQPVTHGAHALGQGGHDERRGAGPGRCG